MRLREEVESEFCFDGYTLYEVEYFIEPVDVVAERVWVGFREGFRECLDKIFVGVIFGWYFCDGEATFFKEDSYKGVKASGRFAKQADCDKQWLS